MTTSQLHPARAGGQDLLTEARQHCLVSASALFVHLSRAPGGSGAACRWLFSTLDNRSADDELEEAMYTDEDPSRGLNLPHFPCLEHVWRTCLPLTQAMQFDGLSYPDLSTSSEIDARFRLNFVFRFDTLPS